MLNKQIKSENQAMARRTNIKKEKTKTCRIKNQAKEAKTLSRQEKIIKNEIKYGL